jgi:hypothetical protein
MYAMRWSHAELLSTPESVHAAAVAFVNEEVWPAKKRGKRRDGLGARAEE